MGARTGPAASRVAPHLSCDSAGPGEVLVAAPRAAPLRCTHALDAARTPAYPSGVRAPRAVHVARGRPTVGVFAPSSPFPPERLAAGLAALEALGFDARVHPSAHQTLGYLAGDDATRLASFHALLDDPEIDVLWAVRGGYGLHRLVDRLDPARVAAAGKPIVGFSDVCALHAVAQRGGLISVHGPVVTQLGELPPEAGARALEVLGGAWDGLRYDSESGPLSGGVARGRLIGGCLSVIVPLLGTPYLPPLDGAILLLEDVGEATYRVDRLLTHLRLAGVLHRVAGVALGEFVGCAPRKDGEPTVEEVLAERLGDLGVPVLMGLPFGHGRKNLAVPLGARVELDCERGRLTVLGP